MGGPETRQTGAPATPQHQSTLSSTDQTPPFAAAFVVKDAAQRWDKAVAFSAKCDISVDTKAASLIVQHKDHPSDPSWRFIFPIASQVKRLVSCQSCRLRHSSQICHNSFPCSACQQQGLRCVARCVLLSPTRAIHGEAEMEMAAEEGYLIDRHYLRFASVAWSFGAGSPNTYEGYLPLPAPLTPLRAYSTQHSLALPATPTGSELRRPNRLQCQIRRVDDTPVPHPRSKQFPAAQCMARIRNLIATGHLIPNSAVGYGLQEQHPPTHVDLGGLELTMAEISVFLLNLAHRAEGAMRIVNNGWTPHHFCAYHNWTRGLKGETRRRGDKGEGAMRTTFTKSIQKTMRIITDDDHWLQTHHSATPITNFSTSNWAHLVDHPPSHSLCAMGAHIRYWPPEQHSLNLTRAVRFAVEHPHIPDDQLRFPTHVRSIVEHLPGKFRSRAAEASEPAENLDHIILDDWKDFQEKQGNGTV